MKRRSFLASLLAPLLPIPAPVPAKRTGYVFGPWIPLFITALPVPEPLLITSAEHFRQVFGEPSANHPINALLKDSDRPLA